MSLYAQIIEIFPELVDSDVFQRGIIILQNDADDYGDYIAKWDYEKPLPKSLKLGKK